MSVKMFENEIFNDIIRNKKERILVMDKKGFTLVELLAVIAILGIIMGIVMVTTTGEFGSAKDKSEEVFISTIEDALEIYLNGNDAKKLKYEKMNCVITKTHGNVSIYKSNITIRNVINSQYQPITSDDLVNPNRQDVNCNDNAKITVYRDDDFVYYYLVEKSELNCLSTCLDNDSTCLDSFKGNKYITNLPEELIKKGCIM